MEKTLWLVAVCFSMGAWLLSGAWRRPEGMSTSWQAVLAPMVPGLLGFLCCVPAQSPFAAGLGLGWGFLLGGAAAVLATRSLASNRPEAATALLPLVAAVALAFVGLRDGLEVALVAIAGGWAGGLLWSGWTYGFTPGVVPSGLAGVALATAAQVGVLRGAIGGPVPKDFWPLLPVMAVLAGILVRSILVRGGGVWAGGAGAGISALTAVVALAGGRMRVEAPWEMVAVFAGGVLLWLLVRLIVGAGSSRFSTGMAGLLIVAAEVMVADQAVNYGVGLWATGFALASLFFPSSGASTSLGAIPVLLSVLRTFVVPRAGILAGAGVAEQVALAALLIAALLPSVVDGLVSGAGDRRLGRLAAGCLIVAVPIVGIVLLGYGTMGAWVLGASVAAFAAGAGQRREPVALAAACSVLAAVAISGVASKLAEHRRSDRVRTAVLVMVVPMALAAVSEGMRRRGVRA